MRPTFLGVFDAIFSIVYVDSSSFGQYFQYDRSEHTLTFIYRIHWIFFNAIDNDSVANKAI